MPMIGKALKAAAKAAKKPAKPYTKPGDRLAEMEAANTSRGKVRSRVIQGAGVGVGAAATKKAMDERKRRK